MLLMFGSSIFFILKTTALLPTQRFWAPTTSKRQLCLHRGHVHRRQPDHLVPRPIARRELELESQGGENAYALLAAEASRSPLGAQGLVALPYFEGERTPLHDPQARGVWFGLGLKHTRGDLYRSILEGVAFGIRHNLEAMAEEGVRPQRILAAGGGPATACGCRSSPMFAMWAICGPAGQQLRRHITNARGRSSCRAVRDRAGSNRWSRTANHARYADLPGLPRAVFRTSR
jgi:hypothetical protein